MSSIRAAASLRLINLRSRAASVAHRYIPMLVGDVYLARLLGLRSPPMLSDGSPVLGATIASNERQVSAA